MMINVGKQNYDDGDDVNDVDGDHVMLMVMMTRGND